jgi:hypothetical protein
MTSISAASTSAYLSPLQKLQDELQSEVSSGAIGSSDQDALSSALTDIDSSLQSQGAPDTTGTQQSPDDLQSKISDLIAGEVSSGKLTSDQAAELQTVFSNTFASGDDGGPDAAGAPVGAGGGHKAGGHHHGGHGGAGGASSSTDSSSNASSASDLLQQFLQSLKDSQSSTTAGYDATGDSNSNSGSTAASALLVDYKS